jgi:diacylglycerol kinase
VSIFDAQSVATLAKRLAAAVLVASIVAAAIGLLVFLPKVV